MEATGPQTWLERIVDGRGSIGERGGATGQHFFLKEPNQGEAPLLVVSSGLGVQQVCNSRGFGRGDGEREPHEVP